MTRRSRRTRPQPEGGAAGRAAEGRPHGGASRSGSGGTAGTPTSRAPSGTARTGRRERAVRRQDRRSFLERYRGLLLPGFAIGGIALLGLFFLQSATRPAYACDSLLTPGPTETAPAGAGGTASPGPASPSPTRSPAPASPSPGGSPTASPTPAGPTPRLGFVTRDIGTGHVRTSDALRYEFCPPTSGDHFAQRGAGPIARDFYGTGTQVSPGGWVHNLEHGYVVALYSCGRDGRSCPSQEELDRMREFFERAPNTEGAQRCRVPNKVLVARFDQMSTRFALLAWDRALLTDAFDVEQALTFAQQWIDNPATPERGGC